jgi:hypothetical protein
MGKRRKDVRSPVSARNVTDSSGPLHNEMSPPSPQPLVQSLAQMSAQQQQQQHQHPQQHHQHHHQPHHQGYLGQLSVEPDGLGSQGMADPRAMGMTVGGTGVMGIGGHSVMHPPVSSSPVSGFAPVLSGSSGLAASPVRNSR